MDTSALDSESPEIFDRKRKRSVEHNTEAAHMSFMPMSCPTVPYPSVPEHMTGLVAVTDKGILIIKSV